MRSAIPTLDKQRGSRPDRYRSAVGTASNPGPAPRRRRRRRSPAAVSVRAQDALDAVLLCDGGVALRRSSRAGRTCAGLQPGPHVVDERCGSPGRDDTDRTRARRCAAATSRRRQSSRARAHRRVRRTVRDRLQRGPVAQRPRKQRAWDGSHEARGDSDEPDRGRHSEPHDEQGTRPLSVLDASRQRGSDADVRGEQDQRQDPPEVRVVDDRAVPRNRSPPMSMSASGSVLSRRKRRTTT